MDVGAILRDPDTWKAVVGGILGAVGLAGGGKAVLGRRRRAAAGGADEDDAAAAPGGARGDGGLVSRAEFESQQRECRAVHSELRAADVAQVDRIIDAVSAVHDDVVDARADAAVAKALAERAGGGPGHG